MEFSFKRPDERNVKPLAQHVKGGVKTEWRIGDDQNRIVKEITPLDTPLVGPSAGTFFLGEFLTTRDELEDYLEEANEVNTKRAQNSVDRLPTIQRKIERAREMHADAIKAAVGWKAQGYKLPKKPVRHNPSLYLPSAVAREGSDGKLHIVGEYKKP